MPFAARRPCTWPGCSQLVQQGSRCDQHRRLQEQQRGSASARGYGRKWQQASAAYLRAHPLCECDECQAGKLKVTAATVVDHKVPHRGDPVLFWDRDNWQAMSKPHHDRKTATEDSGFTRKP